MNGDQPVPPAVSQPPAPKPTPSQGSQSPPEPQGGWQYRPESAATPPAIDNFPEAMPGQLPGPQEAIWSASEFVEHDKSISWYLILGGLTLVVDIILYFWTRDFISIFAVTAMAVLLGVMGSRKPRVLDYRLDSSGLTVGNVFHPYAEFKSFAIMEDGALRTITFLPVKRFMPPISVFYAPEDQEQITEVLGRHLPMELRQRDAIDRFSRRIRL